MSESLPDGTVLPEGFYEDADNDRDQRLPELSYGETVPSDGTVTAPPVASISDFQSFSGLTLPSTDQARVTVAIDRARRKLKSDLVDLPTSWSDTDDVADYKDAVVELAWLYWEAEKADRMQILAVPVTQLSLGTLFWTRDLTFPLGGLFATQRAYQRWGGTGRRRVSLEGEIEYNRL